MKARIALLGLPAAGKGTQAEMIAQKFGISSVSPERLVRNERSSGASVTQRSQAGRLVADRFVFELVSRSLAAHPQRFVLDGFPRSRSQADLLDSDLRRRGCPLEVVIGLVADRETIVERVGRRLVCMFCHTTVSGGVHVAAANGLCRHCGAALERRADDSLEVLEVRMEEYRLKTEPLMGHFSECGLLQSVDATLPADVVFRSIESILVSG